MAARRLFQVWEAGFVTFMGIDQVTGIITDDEIPEESIKELAERTKLRIV